MDKLLFNLMECFVFIGFIPVFIMFLQVALVGFHRFHSHYLKCGSYAPRISVIIPSWNEADVIANTIESLINSNYDREKMRVYLIDDGSTDNTSEIAKAMMEKYPETFFYLHREKGGEGKAHTLNHGLKHILSEPWTEAILIVDADILFEGDTINRMVRHLADPKVGCVTCYIKEGNVPGNLITHFIAYEYIVSTAIARRSQNVLGVLACVAGGAQLHSRTNIELLGEINSSTFAEDTYTTFKTQLLNHSAIFEGNAVVRSEEPSTIVGLWRQRKRWARGNIQLTKIFRKLWFHPKNPSGLGGVFFDLLWFSILLLPLLMVLSSIGLIGIFFLNGDTLWHIFYLLGGVSVFIYLFIAIYACIADPSTMKRAWPEAIIFPGLIATFSLSVAFAPHFFEYLFTSAFGSDAFSYWQKAFLLFISFWVSGCMFFAWLIYRLDRAGVSQKITNPLLILVGYGPLLCVITVSAFISEWTKSESQWDKTEKAGKLPMEIQTFKEPYNFEDTLAKDKKNEVGLFWKEVILLIFLLVLFILRYYFEF